MIYEIQDQLVEHECTEIVLAFWRKLAWSGVRRPFGNSYSILQSCSSVFWAIPNMHGTCWFEEIPRRPSILQSFVPSAWTVRKHCAPAPVDMEISVACHTPMRRPKVQMEKVELRLTKVTLRYHTNMELSGVVSLWKIGQAVASVWYPKTRPFSALSAQERLYHPEFYKILGTDAKDICNMYIEEFDKNLYEPTCVWSCNWCWFDASFVGSGSLGLRSLNTNISASFSWLVPVPHVPHEHLERILPPHAIRTRQCELGTSCKELGCLKTGRTNVDTDTQTFTICAWGVGNKNWRITLWLTRNRFGCLLLIQDGNMSQSS